MATSKLTADIPGIGEIQVNGNIATEETLADLLDAIERLNADLGVETKKLDDQLDETADELDDFTDSVAKAESQQSKLTDRMTGLADRVDNTMTGLGKFSGSTDSASSMVESFGEIAAKFAGGVGGLIPFIGEGTARLAEATAMAVTTITAMAVGMVEQFNSLNRSMMSSGTLLDGGFSGLADAADTAQIPVTAFGEAILSNTQRLRLLSGGAPGGIARLSQGFKALSEAQENNLESLYALGFNNNEVAAGLANVSIAADRAGTNLSSEQLGLETYGYLRNLRELSRLTGITAEEAMAQVEANRANLFVQNQLMDMAPKQQAAAQDFVAALEKSGLGPLADFAMTGQYLNEETAMMATRMGPLAGIMRDYFLQLQAGVDPDVAMQNYKDTVDANQASIKAAMESNARTFGLTRELAAQFGYLGEAGVSITEQLNAAGLNEDPLGGAENLSVTIGALQKAIQDSKSTIQSTFVDGLDRLSGDEGLMTEFARNISGAAIGAEKFAEAIDAIFDGDYNKLSELFSGETSGDASPTVDSPTVPIASPGDDDELYQLKVQLDTLYDTLINNNRHSKSPEELENMHTKFAEQFSGIISRIKELDPDIELRGGFKTGGVTSNPMSGGLELLHGTEAIVPLPDGRSIPVSLDLRGISDLIASLDSILSNNMEQTASNIVPLPDVRSIPVSLDLRGLSDLTTSGLDSILSNNIEQKASNVANVPANTSDTELVSLTKSMLQQMTASTVKLDQLIRSMDQTNVITRTNAYSRA